MGQDPFAGTTVFREDFDKYMIKIKAPGMDLFLNRRNGPFQTLIPIIAVMRSCSRSMTFVDDSGRFVAECQEWLRICL